MGILINFFQLIQKKAEKRKRRIKNWWNKERKKLQDDRFKPNIVKISHINYSLTIPIKM